MATNFVKASYNEIYDLSTQAGDVTTLKFHAPQGTLPQQYLRGFWTQFKKYRYYGSKIMMIPVATLPADPLQVSYAAGEPTIDPRDMVNPILHKIYRGEALIDDVSMSPFGKYSGVDQKVYNSSVVPTVGEDQYYATLQDPSWKKAHVQRGFRSRGIPLVRKLASNVQIGAGSRFGSNIMNPSQYTWDPIAGVQATHGDPGMATAADGGTASSLEPAFDAGPDPDNYDMAPDAQNNVMEMFTSGWDRLGWLDTSQRTWSPFNTDNRTNSAGDITLAPGDTSLSQREMLTRLPKIFTYIAILPPSYKQEMYFRLVISHEFGFKDFRSANMPWDGAFEMPMTISPIRDAGVAPAPPAKSLSVEADSGQVKLTSVGVN